MLLFYHFLFKIILLVIRFNFNIEFPHNIIKKKKEINKTKQEKGNKTKNNSWFKKEKEKKKIKKTKNEEKEGHEWMPICAL